MTSTLDQGLTGYILEVLDEHNEWQAVEGSICSNREGVKAFRKRLGFVAVAWRTRITEVTITRSEDH